MRRVITTEDERMAYNAACTTNAGCDMYREKCGGCLDEQDELLIRSWRQVLVVALLLCLRVACQRPLFEITFFLSYRDGIPFTYSLSVIVVPICVMCSY